MKPNLLVISVFIWGVFINTSLGQAEIKSFKSLSSPEKWWVIWHPFKAKKAFNITQKTLQTVDSLKLQKTLGADLNGGTLDAFKHSFWMAVLSRDIGKKPALKLGIAHEKGNYHQFLKNHKEDNIIPDKPSSTMDTFNNQVGVKLGYNHQNLKHQQLVTLIIEQVQNGHMVVLKKNPKGKFLDCNNEVIDLYQYHGQWDNPKCLAPSNYRYSAP